MVGSALIVEKGDETEDDAVSGQGNCEKRAVEDVKATPALKTVINVVVGG